LDFGSHEGIKEDVQLYGRGSLFPSLLPPSTQFTCMGRKKRSQTTTSAGTGLTKIQLACTWEQRERDKNALIVPKYAC